MHHLDLTLDPDTDASVRRVWQRLADAGLPSLAHHPSASNRPHVTLAMTAQWPTDGAGGSPVAALLGVLPMPVRLGAPLVFGRRSHAVALGVVPTADLLGLHREVARLLPPSREHLRPGRWTPHVTLATRVDAAQLAAVLAVVVAADLPAVTGLSGARHWDSEARLDEPVTGEDVAARPDVGAP